MNEKEFLDKVAETYKTFVSPISKWSINSYIKIYKKHIQSNGKSLELGCSNGYSTRILSELTELLDVVDGSKYMLERMRQELPAKKNVTFIYSLFEELEKENEYENIFCSYILEHVVNPEQLLNKIYYMLRPGGKAFITVPNATALSRQMAFEMHLV